MALGSETRIDSFQHDKQRNRGLVGLAQKSRPISTNDSISKSKVEGDGPIDVRAQYKGYTSRLMGNMVILELIKT